jgi:response regulator of citrate/malate metabolism
MKDSFPKSPVRFERIKKKILEVIEKKDKPVSLSNIASETGLSVPTVSRYVKYLATKEKKIKIFDYGNIKLVGRYDFREI